MLEIEIQYYAIKELYFSPYKIFLNSMTKEDFILKFYKTEKYIGLSKDKVKRYIY